jgi:hypothetical protein
MELRDFQLIRKISRLRRENHRKFLPVRETQPGRSIILNLYFLTPDRPKEVFNRRVSPSCSGPLNEGKTYQQEGVSTREYEITSIFYSADRHCQRPQLVKSISPKGSRVAIQIEQYLLCSAVQLTSCSSPSATVSRLTSIVLPHVSLGASQLLKPASTTPGSYGRRHRTWHYEPQAQTKC